MAKLRRKYASQDEIPEALRDVYTVQTDGSWLLDTDGPGEADVMKLQQALEHEKTHRTTATKRLQEYEEKYREIDPAKAREALEKIDQLEEERLRAEKQFEELAERKWSRKVSQLEQQITQLNDAVKDREGKIAQVRTKFADVAITEQLKQAALETGVDPKKLRFLINEARQAWQFDEQDRPVPMEKGDDGELRLMYGTDPGKPLTMQEHIKMLTKENPWFLLESTGGGTRNGQNTQMQGSQVIITRAQAKDNRFVERTMNDASAKGLEVVFQDA